MDDDRRADDRTEGPLPTTPSGSRWPSSREDLKQGHRPRLRLGIPALDDIVTLYQDSQHVVVIALPWEPAGETPFVVAQALAKQGASPFCIHPSWSPYWDGSLKVLRLGNPPGPVSYHDFRVRTDGYQPVIIDQFSRLHWDDVHTHDDREEVVSEAGRALHWLSWERQAPVIVFVRRRTRDVIRMSVRDLRSDGALEYHANALLMVDPNPETGTADVLVVKHRNGPTGLREGVPWPALPRTVYCRTSR